MSRFLNRKSIACVLVAFALVGAFLGSVAFRGATHAAASPPPPNFPKSGPGLGAFCSSLGKTIQASSAAHLACTSPGSVQSFNKNKKGTSNNKFGSNVNAANPQEDMTPSGVQVYGQSEVSIASEGQYVVEAWNDATGFFYPDCSSPQFKEELTGYGFSSNGGKSFVDEGGLPNAFCTAGYKYYGDPSVEVYKVGGNTYFYISSLYLNSTTGDSFIAMDACPVSGSSISCTGPYFIAHGGPGDFLDKDFLTIDPIRARLYNSYTRFGSTIATANGQIELAVCDLSTPSAPTCYPGFSPTPYLVVQPGDANCENEGAYPAADVKTGDVYVAWEYNWATNYINCTAVPTAERVAYVPFACLTLTPVSPCATTPLQNHVNIHSIDLAFIPGFNRNPTGSPANDFPRIAVSDQYGTVSIVWNDTRYHPLGDILLQSFQLVSLSYVQHDPTGAASPVRINTLANGGLHFMPALRNVDDDGDLNISFYQRNIPATDLTYVYAAIDVSPTATTTPKSNVRVTTAPSPWIDTSSDIVPNFGDYTDNYVQAQPCTQSSPSVTPICTTQTFYVAWSDGRIGEPQPFNAQAHTN